MQKLSTELIRTSNEYWAERFAQLEALAYELGIEIYAEVQKDLAENPLMIFQQS